MEKRSGTMQVPTHYLNAVIALAEGYGVRRRALLMEVGLSQAILDDPDARIDTEQFRGIILGALRDSGQPSLGLQLGSQLRVTGHGILGYAAMSSSTLEEALTFVTRFVQTRTPLLLASIARGPRHVAIRIEEAAVLGEIRQALLELALSACCSVAGFLTDGQFRCRRVLMPFPEPEHVDLYRDVFACPLEFGASVAELRFDKSLLAMQLPFADETAKRQAARRCEEELAAIEASDDIEQQIRVRMLKMEQLTPCLDETARELGLSPRTLRRRLHNAGTSYQKILNAVRSELAVQYLQTTDLTVYQIADRLGYNEPSNFGRAFKGWAGASPQTFRDSLRAPGGDE